MVIAPPAILLPFDLHLAPDGDAYRARVLSSPVGEANAPFTPPAAERAALPLWERGALLFDALFRDAILIAWRRSLDAAKRQDGALRLRLRLAEVPALAALPWEALYDRERGGFLATSRQTPLVRYLDLPLADGVPRVAPPLRLLALLASPADEPPLDVDREWVQLQEAIAPLQGQIGATSLPAATAAALQTALRREGAHIVHFMGHGRWNEATGQGALLFEDERGHSRAISAEELAMLLSDQRSLRLVVLSACEGARPSVASAFAGVAQRLVQQSIPAVIAMQGAIQDEAALAWSHEFYRAFADGDPVDVAVVEGRKALSLRGGDEWALPVLFMRAADGQLFHIQRPVPTSPPRESSPDGYAYDTYISYIDMEPDSGWLWETLLPRLEAAGLRVAVAGDDAPPGVPTIVSMEEGMAAAKRTIVVLSDRYLANHMAEFESAMAQTMGIQEGLYRLLPLTFEPFDRSRLSLRLSQLVTLDLGHPHRAEREFQRLIEALRGPLPRMHGD